MPFTIREDHRLSVFENGVLKNILGLRERKYQYEAKENAFSVLEGSLKRTDHY